MKHITKLFLLLLIFSSQVNAWTMEANFENGTTGDKAELPNKDAFHGNAGASKYTSTKKHSGKQSGSVSIKKGSDGFGKWGGTWKFPSKLKRGDEIWFRTWVYFPTGWSFSCDGCAEGMKFMRIRVSSESGGNAGYHHNYINTNGRLYIGGEVKDSAGNTVFSTYPTWTDPTLRGAAGEDVGSKFPGVAKVSLGTWHAFEQYIKFDPTPGKGVRRTWYDGKLVFEDTSTGTMHSSKDFSENIYMLTYWNNGAPKDQTAFIDDVIITSDKPSNSDSFGNPYIGTGNVKFTSPPKPPSSVITEQ